MAIRLNDGARNACLDGGLINALEGGTLEIRTGGQPANAGLAATGTLLSSIDLPADAWSAAAAGAAAKTGTWQDTAADATGLAGWFRIRNDADTVRIDGTVGESAADMIIDDADIVQNGQVTVTAFTITMPAS
jgi:hypothetical protein